MINGDRIVTGKRPGRENDHEITCFKSIGIAIKDAAAAKMVYDRAIKQGPREDYRDSIDSFLEIASNQKIIDSPVHPRFDA